LSDLAEEGAVRPWQARNLEKKKWVSKSSKVRTNPQNPTQIFANNLLKITHFEEQGADLGAEYIEMAEQNGIASSCRYPHREIEVGEAAELSEIEGCSVSVESCQTVLESTRVGMWHQASAEEIGYSKRTNGSNSDQHLYESLLP